MIMFIPFAHGQVSGVLPNDLCEMSVDFVGFSQFDYSKTLQFSRRLPYTERGLVVVVVATKNNSFKIGWIIEFSTL